MRPPNRDSPPDKPAGYIGVMLRELLVAGAAGGATEAIFYSLDSLKVLMHLGKDVTQSSSMRLSLLFRGMIPSVVFGSVPSFGAFFMCYVPLKEQLERALIPGSSAPTQVLIASTVAAFPSALIAVPSDVVKKTLLATGSRSYRHALMSILARRGPSGLFTGWAANVSRDVPFIMIKMSIYEGLGKMYKRFNSTTRDLDVKETAAIGFASGAMTAIFTNPMDAANTRIKSGQLSHLGVLRACVAIQRADGVAGLFRGLGPRMVITGFGSTVFWFLYTALHEHHGG